MNIRPLHEPVLELSREYQAGQRADSFQEVLTSTSGELETELSTGLEPGANRKLREAVQQLVASSLVVPLLKELRQEPLDAGLFHGGLAEDTFQQQLETTLADRMVRNPRFAIADRIYESLLPRFASFQKVDIHG